MRFRVMLKYCLFLFCVVCQHGAWSQVTPAPELFLGQSNTACCQIDLKGENSILSLGHEYQRIKSFKNDSCCLNYESSVYDILSWTVSKLKINTSKSEILEIFGNPDFIADMNNNIKQQPFGKFVENEALFIYYFHSKLDYFYLLLNNDVLIDKGMFMAD